MPEGSKVGEGYVELGLDKNPLVNALRSSGKTFSSWLDTAGKQARDFSQAMGNALGVAVPIGFGAGLVKAIKDIVDETPQLSAFYIAMAEMGIGVEDAKRLLIDLSAEMRKLGAVSRGEMASIITQFARLGITGREELVEMLKDTASAARRGGASFESAAKHYADLIRIGKPLPEQYGVILGPEALPRERIAKTRELLRAGREMAEAIAQLPQEKVKRRWSAIWDGIKEGIEQGIEAIADPQRSLDAVRKELDTKIREFTTDPTGWYKRREKRWQFQELRRGEPFISKEPWATSPGIGPSVMEKIAAAGQKSTAFNTGLGIDEIQRRGGVGRIGAMQTGLTEEEQAARAGSLGCMGGEATSANDLLRAITENTDAVRENNARLLNAEQRALTAGQTMEGPF